VEAEEAWCRVLAQRHDGKDDQILENRHAVYEPAKLARPDRWRTRPTRDWSRVEKVWLNPPKEHVSGCENLKRAA